MTRAGSPHSDTLGSQPASRLPEAYRRPPRPSSAPDAKASTERPKKQNTNPTKDKQHHRPHPHTTRRGRGPRHTKNKDTRVHYTDHNQPTHRSTPPAHHQQDTTQATPGRTAPEPDSMRPPPHTRCRDRHPNPPTPIKKKERGSERASRATTRNPRDQTPHRRPPPTALALPHLFS